jgi:hypothetical protein
MTSIDPKYLGLIRGIGMTVLTAVLTYLGDAANLAGVFSAGIAGVIASIALAAEHSIEARGNGALFGAVRSPLGSNKVATNK